MNTDMVWAHTIGDMEIEGLTKAHKRLGQVTKLVPDSDPLLSSPLPQFDWGLPPADPIQLAWDLAVSMKAHAGIGLSANQIGLPYRVFSIASAPMMVCFNPRIVEYSSELVKAVEGCLTYPDIVCPVMRSKSIRVRYQMATGEVVSKSLDGIYARVFLHEYDHMEGINFLDRTSKFHRERIENKLRIRNRRLKTK